MGSFFQTARLSLYSVMKILIPQNESSAALNYQSLRSLVVNHRRGFSSPVAFVWLVEKKEDAQQ